MARAIGRRQGNHRSRRAVLSAVQRALVQQSIDHEERPGFRRSADLENDSFFAARSAYRSDQRSRDAQKAALRSGGRKEVVAVLAPLGSGVLDQRGETGEQASGKKERG